MDSLPTTHRPIDDTLIKSWARKDRRQAIELVVRCYRDRLYRHAFCILKDPQEACDAVQEVFIKAMREPRFFDEAFRIKAWLYRVTSNLCYNMRRDRLRRGTILESMEVTSRAPANQVDQVHADKRRTEILSWMDALTEDHREILVLRYYDDLTYEEIAEVLDVKMGTVMSRLSRARTRLGEMLGQDHPFVQEILAAQEG